MIDTNETSWDDIEITPLDGGGSDDVVIGDEGGTQPSVNSQEDNDTTNIDDIVIGEEANTSITNPSDTSDDIIVNVPEGTTAPVSENGNEGENSNDTSDLSGIEQYLATFDIEGGMIQFDDGTSEHFDDLDAAKQKDVLDELHNSQVPDIEDEYGLEDDELNLINYCRDNELTIQQLVENMADQRVNAMLAMQTGVTADYKNMQDDAVFMQFLQRNEPSADITKLEAALEEAKGTSTYKATVGSLRNQFQNEQTTLVQQKQQSEYQAEIDKIEDQRVQVVAAAQNIDDIAGVQLNDTVKNSILDKVLNVNDDFDSVFIEEALGDPAQAFKTAFWYYYGEDVLQQRDEYWKKEKSAAYKRGMEDALGGSSETNQRVSFTDNSRQSNRRDDRQSGRTTPNKQHRTNPSNTSDSWDDTFV